MTNGTKLDRSKDIWDLYRPRGASGEVKYGIYYLKDSNVTGNTSGNIMCTFLGQPHINQEGYSPSTIGSGNYFLTINSASTSIGNSNVSCFTSGQSHTIANGNYYLGIFGSDNTIGNSNYASFIFGQTNTLGSSSSYNAFFGASNSLGSTSNNNLIFGFSNIIESADYMNFFFGENNRIANSNLYNIVMGSNNDFSAINSISYNTLFGSNTIIDSSVNGTLTNNVILGDAHSLEGANIKYNLLSGYGHSALGGNGLKYTSAFGYMNYLVGSTSPQSGQCALVTGRYAKGKLFACHVNSGGHPSLTTIPAGDMEDDCGAGQNIGMIPHNGMASGAGFRPIYMNGANNGEVYTLENNKTTLLVTYVVASADISDRVKAWRIETLARRPVIGDVVIVSTTVTVIGTTSVGGESAWDVRNVASGGYIQLQVDPGGVMPVMFQAYGLGPEVISTEEYLS